MPSSWLSREGLLTLALVALCLADLSGGGYATWLGFAALFTFMGLMAAVMLASDRLPEGAIPRLAPPLLAVLLVVRFSTASPIVILPVAITFVLCVLADNLPSQKAVLLVLGLLVAVGTVVMVIWVRTIPNHVDVIPLIKDGSLRLFAGRDPYTGQYYSSTLGATHIPYTYSPVTLFVAAPGALLGDVRYSNILFALVTMAGLGALAMGWFDRQSAGRLPAEGGVFAGRRKLLLVLAVPLMLPMVWAGWTEVFLLGFLFWWLALRQEHPIISTVCLALAIGTKYTVVLPLAPLAVWAPRMRRQMIVAGIASAVFVYLPFIIWAGPARYLHDTILYFLQLPQQPNTLALQSLLAYFHLSTPGLGVTALVLACLLCALAVWRPKDLSSLLLAAAFFTSVAFLLNRWSYFNYWAMAGYILLAAILTTGVDEPFARPWENFWTGRSR